MADLRHKMLADDAIRAIEATGRTAFRSDDGARLLVYAGDPRKAGCFLELASTLIDRDDDTVSRHALRDVMGGFHAS